MDGPEVIAILNTSPDTVEMLQVVFEHAGFRVVSGYIRDLQQGRLDLEAFMREHNPAVIVWDIALPYDRQWQFFQQTKQSGVCGRCRFVLTTTNAAEVAKIAGSDQLLHEIVGKPYDLGELVRAVKEAVRERPTI